MRSWGALIVRDGGMKNWMLALVLAGATITGHSAEVVNHFEGYAYDLDSGKYLYTEVHQQRVVDGQWAGGSTDYVFPDGTRFGRKTYDFAGDKFLPTYTLDLVTEGYAEAIAGNGANIEMSRRRAGQKVETASVEKNGLVAADTGLPRMLLANWDTLVKGEKLKFRIAAPSRLDTFKFKAKRIEDTTFEGKPAVQIQVDMNSMLNMFIGPLLFTFDPEDKRVKEFRGTTNIRNPATGADYKVRISYYATRPEDAPPKR